MRDSALTYCPLCEQKTLKKLINNQGGFTLKGSGWAKDGYK
jgi:predicted nucleic acid-binding Zn ribbon protein